MEEQPKKVNLQIEKEHRSRETADASTGGETERKTFQPSEPALKPKPARESFGQTDFPKLHQETQAGPKFLDKESLTNPRRSEGVVQTGRLNLRQEEQESTTYIQPAPPATHDISADEFMGSLGGFMDDV